MIYTAVPLSQSQQKKTNEIDLKMKLQIQEIGTFIVLPMLQYMLPRYIATFWIRQNFGDMRGWR